MKKLKLGKTFTTLIVLAFCVIGIIILFSKESTEKMSNFERLVQLLFPYLIPILGGVAINGTIKSIKNLLKKSDK
ncbi:MAG: hypothetical protein WC516_06625 [Patescibacteria group bacterium]|jgi:uncharacterized alpha/beta hydrolase family protein